jgi:hypothetical protein
MNSSNSSNNSSSNNNNNNSNSPNESDKENDVVCSSSNKHGVENNSPTLASSNGPSSNSSRVLSIKERKEFFSKKQPSNSTNSIYEKNNSSTSCLRMQKRLRSSETTNVSSSSSQNKNSDTCSSKNSRFEFEQSGGESLAMDNESSVHLLNNGEIEFDGDYDHHDGLSSNGDQADGGISANQIFSSAKQKQLDKEANAKTKTSVKLKTFYGGEEIKNMDDLRSMQKKSSSNSAAASASVKLNVSNNSVEYLNVEFIGAGVKLEKSILIVSTSNPGDTANVGQQTGAGASRSKKKKLERVNFTDAAETYEYPSYEFMLKEMGIDPSSDPDYQIVPLESGSSNSFGTDDDDNARCGGGSSIINKPSYTQFLPGLVVNDGTGDSSSTDEGDPNDKKDADKNFTKLGMCLSLFVKYSRKKIEILRSKC